MMDAILPEPSQGIAAEGQYSYTAAPLRYSQHGT